MTVKKSLKNVKSVLANKEMYASSNGLEELWVKKVLTVLSTIYNSEMTGAASHNDEIRKNQ